MDDTLESMYASLSDLIDRLWTNETEKYPEGEPFSVGLRSGTMLVELFAPRGEDLQEPHDQDELYLIIRGRATLKMEGDDLRCGEGDAITVPAGTPHHFEDISDDFMSWAVFWGPRGGEATG